jgi:Uncharacterized conserved protein
MQTTWLSFRFKNALAGLKPYDPKDGIFTLKQIHSDRVVLLDEEIQEEGDAIITTRKNFPIGVRTADCVPLAFLGERAVGVVHAGWRGIKAGIVERFLEKFLPIERAHFAAKYYPVARRRVFYGGVQSVDICGNRRNAAGGKYRVVVPPPFAQGLKPPDSYVVVQSTSHPGNKGVLRQKCRPHGNSYVS